MLANSNELTREQIIGLLTTYGDPLIFDDFTDKQLCWLIEQAWHQSVANNDTGVATSIKVKLAEFRLNGGVANRLELMRQDPVKKDELDDWLHRALSYVTDLAAQH